MASRDQWKSTFGIFKGKKRQQEEAICDEIHKYESPYPVDIEKNYKLNYDLFVRAIREEAEIRQKRFIKN